jgi:hypothetical protein
VAYASDSIRPRQLLSVRWYAADGSRVQTSTAALVQAAKQGQATRRAQALKTAERSTYHADPRLLSAFAVFSVTSRSGIRLTNGVTISDPPLTSLPTGILSSLAPNDRVTEPDPHAVRQVTMPSGIRFWVIAGQRGFCVAEIDPRGANLGNPALAPLYGEGGSGEACAPNVADALAHGSGLSSGDATGSTVYMVRPKAHPFMTIQTGPHSHRTIAPPYGVYAAHTSARIG